jgi:hypothetical protein
MLNANARPRDVNLSPPAGRRIGTGWVVCSLGLLFGPRALAIPVVPETGAPLECVQRSVASEFLCAGDKTSFLPPVQLASFDLERTFRNADFSYIFADLERPNDDSGPGTPATGKSTLPVAIVLALGAAWRFYTSPTYLRLYESLYGPLAQY